jgi:hypothetical protein
MRMPSLDAAMQRTNVIVQECISLYMYMWYLQLSGIMIQTSSKEEEKRKEEKRNNKSKQVGKRKKNGCRFLFPCFSQSLPKLVYLRDAYSI